MLDLPPLQPSHGMLAAGTGCGQYSSWRLHWGDPNRPCWPWQTLEDPGILWQTLADLCRPWQTLTDPGRLWKTMADFCRPWQTPADSSRSWQILADPGRPLHSLADSCRPWQTFEEPGRPRPAYCTPQPHPAASHWTEQLQPNMSLTDHQAHCVSQPASLTLYHTDK